MNIRLRSCGYGKTRGQLAKAVYATTARFPARETYGLSSQCNRAVISVAANLAEGSARQGPKDQAHFSEIAYGSLMELACLLILSTDIGILTTESELINYANQSKRYPLK